MVPINDLARALALQREDLHRAIDAVLARGRLVHGPEHAAFERDLAACVGVAHAVGVASGTDALELALRAVRTDGRDVVVTVANAGGYASVAARRAGLRVRYCDVDPGTHLLDPAHLAGVLDAEVCAVVVTHLYGRLADVAAVRAVVEPWGAAVIEDCAQAFGAVRGGARGGVHAGSLGDAAAFSFYPTKNLGALGDGGAVTTDRADVAARVTRLRQYGWGEKYRIVDDGGRNSRLDEIQAAVLRYRMPLVAAGNARRREVIARYAAAAPASVRVLDAVGPEHAAHLAVVEADDAARLAAHLRTWGIMSEVHYPVPDHHQPAFLTEGRSPVSLPVTESLVGRVLSLPCFPELTDAEIERVCRALAAY